MLQQASAEFQKKVTDTSRLPKTLSWIFSPRPIAKGEQATAPAPRLAG